MKNIAALWSASNFEKQAGALRDLNSVFKESDDVLYVMTSYDAAKETDIPIGDLSIYTLATKKEFDGYLIDDTINNAFVDRYFFETGRFVGKCVVMNNAESEVAPSVELDSYAATEEILEHLITVHGCKKINYVADFDWLSYRYSDYGGVKAYRSVLRKHGIPVEEKRMVSSIVSIPKAEALWDEFKARGIDDCDAVFCYMDIYAIGLYLRLAKEGIKVPEDIKMAVLTRSGNSAAFMPDFSGTVIEDRAEAIAMKELLYEEMNGTMKRTFKMFRSKGVFGGSCGCHNHMNANDENRCREIVLNKINSGAQIRVMMNFNDSLEKVSSLEEYAEIIKNMYDSLGFKNYAVCINRKDIAYILDADKSVGYDPNNPFDDIMYVLAGKEGENEITGMEIPSSQITPFNVKGGDMVSFMPIVHMERSFGYVAMLNESLPFEQYNYRIIIESLGSSIENLRRQMALKHSLNEMSDLRMKDPLTGYYNRESIKSFKESIVKLKEFTIVMMDMDGLKKVNDVYGHEEGNRAIVLLANAINRALHTGDILARYGGDEFAVMSPMDTSEYWLEQRESLNKTLAEIVEKENLPYKLGVSIGFAVHNEENNYPIDRCFELADECMYANKVSRKAQRQD